ncbi:MAG: M67 family metallopeptidase [Candidatus Omnitrophica bacterium]|jgi:proteasome lid subunit RPN8/RPN11|nr:M67 family metallopeptidase [Candidatus Omnitrophota bacterium]
MSISLKRSDLEDIIGHARKAFPGEACGFLAGKENMVSKVYRMVNAGQGTMSYSVSIKDQLEATRRMRAEGDDMIGIYHSHPDSRPYPSSKDIRMALHPGCSYLIISLMGGAPEVRSFRIAAGLVKEEPVDVA